MSHWTDAHITYDKVTKEYTGWDETGCDYVIKSSDRQEVVAALVRYAEELEKK